MGETDARALIAAGLAHDEALTSYGQDHEWVADRGSVVFKRHPRAEFHCNPSNAIGIAWMRTNLRALLTGYSAALNEVDALRRRIPNWDLVQMTAQRDALLHQVVEQGAAIRSLETRKQELLATIVRVTNETPFTDEIKGWQDQRAKLVAEVGTLRARVAELENCIEVNEKDRQADREAVRVLRIRLCNMAARLREVPPLDCGHLDLYADEIDDILDPE